MTKLEDHVVEIEGKKYVPYDIAQIALYEGMVSELTNAKSMIQDAFKDLNNALIQEEDD